MNSERLLRNALDQHIHNSCKIDNAFSLIEELIEDFEKDPDFTDKRLLLAKKALEELKEVK